MRAGYSGSVAYRSGRSYRRNSRYRRRNRYMRWAVSAILAIVVVLVGITLGGRGDKTQPDMPAATIPTAVTEATTAPETVPVTASPADILEGLSAYDASAVIRLENETLSASDFELPVVGATGYVSVNTYVYSKSDLKGDPSGALTASDAFYITEDLGNVWKISSANGLVGYISNSTCFINLPDIIPSIVYNITNSSKSVFLSSGKDIPDVTGKKLMDFYKYNDRFQKDMYMAFIQYPMAKKIQVAQESALKEGNTLVIYESYRTFAAQMKVADSLKKFAATDDEVEAGLTEKPWALNWFIATGLSTHQKGCAIDVTLASINEFEVFECGEYRYLGVTDYEEYTMQCKIHELSTKAVSLAYPVNGRDNQWVNVPDNSMMTQGSKTLKKYCTEAGMAPLASEWWHFDDWDAVENLGKDFLTEYNFSYCVSKTLE